MYMYFPWEFLWVKSKQKEKQDSCFVWYILSYKKNRNESLNHLHYLLNTHIQVKRFLFKKADTKQLELETFKSDAWVDQLSANKGACTVSIFEYQTRSTLRIISAYLKEKKIIFLWKWNKFKKKIVQLRPSSSS